MKTTAVAVVCAICLVYLAADAAADSTQPTVITGELKKWHKITLTFTGPQSDETAKPNPFLD
jgi:hypothetical protein